MDVHVLLPLLKLLAPLNCWPSSSHTRRGTGKAVQEADGAKTNNLEIMDSILKINNSRSFRTFLNSFCGQTIHVTRKKFRSVDRCVLLLSEYLSSFSVGVFVPKIQAI